MDRWQCETGSKFFSSKSCVCRLLAPAELIYASMSDACLINIPVWPMRLSICLNIKYTLTLIKHYRTFHDSYLISFYSPLFELTFCKDTSNLKFTGRRTEPRTTTNKNSWILIFFENTLSHVISLLSSSLHNPTT